MSESLKRKILVLDDDRIQHLVLRKRIAMLNHDIDLIFFEDAINALNYIKAVPTDVVISDINLHEMDGWQFLEEIQDFDFKGKFYLLSGSIFPDDRLRADQDSRVSGFFEKPIQESDLIFILGM